MSGQAAGPALRQLGKAEYVATWEAMRAFTARRDTDTPDELWIVEHPPVYTLGQAGRREHLLATDDIPVVDSDRGGQVTYHGPGQVVVYTLIDLRRRGIFVKELVYRIEQAVIQTLAAAGVDGRRVRGAPGCTSRSTRQHAAWPRRSSLAWRRWPRSASRSVAVAVSRRGAERRDGPCAVRPHRPLRLCRPADRRPRYTRRQLVVGRCREPPEPPPRRPPLARHPVVIPSDRMSSEIIRTPTPGADPFAKKKGEAKTAPVIKKFPLRVVTETAPLRKPEWIRVRAGSPSTRFYEIKNILREHRLHTVCEEPRARTSASVSATAVRHS